MDSARLGTHDYDFESEKLIKEGGQASVYELKSKIDGKTYAAKCLQYQIDYKNTADVKAAAQREISCLRTLDHPMIVKMLDLVKDKGNHPCIIMEKCN